MFYIVLKLGNIRTALNVSYLNDIYYLIENVIIDAVALVVAR